MPFSQQAWQPILQVVSEKTAGARLRQYGGTLRNPGDAAENKRSPTECRVTGKPSISYDCNNEP
jgi:hypothetical protein